MRDPIAIALCTFSAAWASRTPFAAGGFEPCALGDGGDWVTTWPATFGIACAAALGAGADGLRAAVVAAGAAVVAAGAAVVAAGAAVVAAGAALDAGAAAALDPRAAEPDPGWPEPGWPEPGWPEPGWPEPFDVPVAGCAAAGLGAGADGAPVAEPGAEDVCVVAVEDAAVVDCAVVAA